jgi:hypothetical protein
MPSNSRLYCLAYLVSFQRIYKRKKPISDVTDDWLFLVAGDQAISNFLEGYELVVDLLNYMNRRDD